jgi:predicted DNA-binding transcriptional regulator YafY
MTGGSMYWARHLVKILKAVEILARPGGATMDELREGLEVDRRTAYRLRDTLEELNFPLYEDSSSLDGRKRFRLDDSYLKKLPNLNVPDLNLSLSEVIALYFIRGYARTYRGTDIERNIEGAFAKLDAFMPDRMAEQLDKVKTLFIAASRFNKDYSDKQEAIDQLTDAIFRRITCTVQYHSFHDDQTKQFRIDPLRFFERDGGLYLFTRTTDYGHIRVLAVERIGGIELSSDSFIPPEQFDPEQLLEGAFGIVYDDPVTLRLSFASDTARYIKERRWAVEQEITELPDGSIVLVMKTSGWFEIKRWILSFGSRVKVLEPQEMLAEIHEELKTTLSSYSSTSAQATGETACSTD